MKTLKPVMGVLTRVAMIIMVVFNSLGTTPVNAQSPFAPKVQPARQDDGNTETPSPTATSTETTTPTATGTPEFSESSTETGTPEFTETPTGMEPPTFTSTPPVPTDSTSTATSAPTEITPTFTPTITAPTETPMANPIVLRLDATPERLLTNGKTTLHWSIEGLDEKKLEGWVLKITFPDGVMPDEDKTSTFDPKTNTIAISVSQMKGTLQIQAGKEIQEAVIEASLFHLEGIAATTQLILGSKESFELSRYGGEAHSEDGRIKVKFPSGMLAEDILLEMGKPSESAAPKYPLSNKTFELKAFGKDSKNDLTHFNGKITIEVNYADLNIEPSQEENLYLYWYNTETQGWAALHTTVDEETKTLKAETDHFTVFDVGVHNWQAAHLPTIEGFQVSEFTGAGTYSYPIDVPPGPGGLQPSLALNYNSQVVDQATISTQASWVGMGWSLELGSIELNTNGTEDYGNDDTYFLNVGGVSTRLLRDTNNNFHAEDENFWKITFDWNGNIWTVQDKAGNTYTFGAVGQNGFASQKPRKSDCNVYTYKWSLASTQNIYGKTLSYDYNEDHKDVKCGNGSTSQLMHTAVYPKSITYPNGKYKITFFLEDRLDFFLDWDTDDAAHLYQKRRLDRIEISNIVNNNSLPIRTYEMGYASDSGPGTIFPNLSFRAGNTGHVSALTSIQQISGLFSESKFPATTFSYTDGLHLDRINNGYGGRVEFDYGQVFYEAEGTPPGSIATYNFGEDNLCKEGYVISSSDTALTSYWYALPYTNYNHNCSGDASVEIWGSATYYYVGTLKNKTVYSPSLLYLTRPAGWYKLTANVTELSSSGTPPKWRMGAVDYQGSHYSPDYDSVSEKVFYTPLYAGAGMLAVFVQTGTWDTRVKLTKFTVEMLPTYYSVTQKRIYTSPTDNDPNIYTYSYLDPGMNGPGNSEAAAQCIPPYCKEYVEEYSEFRGYETVTAVDPNGKITRTTFWQNDKFKGKPKLIEVFDGITDKLLSSTIFTYAENNLVGNGDNVILVPLIIDGIPGNIEYAGISRSFIYTSQVEQRMYASNGSYTSTLTKNYYDFTNGNLIKTEELGNGGAGYRKTVYTYVTPNIAKNLTGLIAKREVLAWNANETLDGNEEAVTIYLYDGQTGNHNVIPDYGKLTSVRTLASELADGTNVYSQMDYDYDTWGNIKSQKVYKNYGSWNATPSGESFTTFTCYGVGDTLGNKSCEDDGYYTYPKWIKNPLGHVTSLSYDYRLSVPVSEIDPNSNETVANYDFLGRLANLTRPLSSASTSIDISYNDGNGSVSFPFTATFQLRVDSDSVYSVTRKYDGAGHMYESLAGGYTTQYTYNTIGQVLTQTEPFIDNPNINENPSLLQINTYDVLGRPLNVTTPASTIKYKYDGLITTLTEPDTDGSTHDTVTTMDEWGRVNLVNPPDGPDISYAYDLLNRLTSTTRGIDTNNQPITTSIWYNFAGQKTEMHDPDMGIWKYQYDALGNLTSQEDARQCILSMTYDPLSRLTHKYSNDVNVCKSMVDTYYYYDNDNPSTGGYDPSTTNQLGYRTFMKDINEGSTTWTYDARGRISNEIKVIKVTGQPSQSFTTGWTYNDADLIDIITYPDGEQIKQDYNSEMLLNSLYSITDNQYYVSNTVYDSVGRVSQRFLGANVLLTRFAYAPWGDGGRLNAIAADNIANHTVIQHINYNYDNVGNVKTITNSMAGPEEQSFEYDKLNRLTKWTLGSFIENYAYDPATGNLANKAGKVFGFDPSHDHAVSTVNQNGAQTAGFQYDSNGNMTSRTVDGLLSNFTYDAEGRLVSVVGTTTPTPPPLPSPTPVVNTPTQTATATVTNTPSRTPSKTPTKTATVTPTHTPQPTPVFTDVPSGTYRPYIEALYNSGIISGCATSPDRLYCPNDYVTRAQAAVLLLKSKYGAGYAPPAIQNGDTGFTDVLDDGPNGYARWIKELKDEGITTGCGSGIYCPTAFITRQDFAILLWRTWNNNVNPNSYSAPYFYDDISTTDVYGKNFIHALAVLPSTINVRDYDPSPNYFSPSNSLKRERAAYFLVRLFGIPMAAGQNPLASLDSPAPLTTIEPTGKALIGPKPLAAPAIQSGGLIFADGFESGNFNAWSWAITDGGDLSASTQAAAVGTYGMKALVDDTNNIYAQSEHPTNETQYSLRFYMDPNSVAMPNNQYTYILTADSDPDGWVFGMYMEKMDDLYRLTPFVMDDTSQWLESRSVFITDGWQAIELEWKSATAPGANNGYLKLWINDVQVDAITNIDSDTLKITDIALGFVEDPPTGSSGSMYFDAIESRQGGHIGLDPNGPSLPAPLSDLIFKDDFESQDFSLWSSSTVDGGDLSVTPASALFGAYGMRALIDDNNAIYARNNSPETDKGYRARFYFDPNSVTIPVNKGFYIFTGNSETSSALRINLNNVSGAYKLQTQAYTDANAWVSGQQITISDVSQMIEIAYQASSAAGANDGYLQLWVNDTLVDTISNIDNDTRAMDSVYLGATGGLDTGTSGSIYFDEFESRRTTHIGPVSTGPTPTPSPTPTTTPTYTPSVTLTPSKTNTPSVTPTPSKTSTPTSTPSVTFTPSKTNTPSQTPSATSTPTKTFTPSVTFTPSKTNTPSQTPSATSTPTSTFTPSATSSPTSTASNTPSPTPTASQGGGGVPISINASFQYDGDGRRVSQTINGVTTYFVGNYYEVTGGVVTKYYYAGAQRVAVRTNGTLNFLFGDHLGSTSLVTDIYGNAVLSEMRYTPWGEVRYNAGTTPTDYTYTGQYSNTADFGLMFYNARWYDPYLGRMAQADTIIPPGVQGLDRYHYANNNPVRYNDPTGHCSGDSQDANNPDAGCWETLTSIEAQYPTVDIDPANWTEGELQVVENSINAVENSFGGSEAFQKNFQDVTISRADKPNPIIDLLVCGDEGCAGLTSGSSITLYDSAFDTSGSESTWDIIHELGHVFDNSDSGLPFSDDFAGENWENCFSLYGSCLIPGAKPSGSLVSNYAGKNPGEDFAETFTITIWSDNFDLFIPEVGGMSTGPTTGRFYQPYNREWPDSGRIDYMRTLIQ